MRTKTLIAFALVLVLAIATAGCGDDKTTATDEPATTETSSEATPAAGDSSGDDTDGGETIALAADPGGSLKFEESSLKTKAGNVTIELTNDSSVPHDVAVESSGDDVGKSDEVTGGKTKLELNDLKAGDYTYYCSVPGHRQAGMEGKLTVE